MQNINSIFQYEVHTMAQERTYQKGLYLPFRMDKRDIVFNQFQVEYYELIKGGIILYHLVSRYDGKVNYHQMNPTDEGFKLITERTFKDINLMSNPNRKLDFGKTLNPNLLED